MPTENIDGLSIKQIKMEAELSEVTYEGYAPHGVAIFIECLTDNNQRTVSLVRSVFNKRGGNMGTNGSLSFIFDRKAVFTVKRGSLDPDEFQLEIIDAGVEECEVTDDLFIITTALEDFKSMNKKLERYGS
jgi:transcriptional/translational regulatory protein YebC/TACO1